MLTFLYGCKILWQTDRGCVGSTYVDTLRKIFGHRTFDMNSLKYYINRDFLIYWSAPSVVITVITRLLWWTGCVVRMGNIWSWIGIFRPETLWKLKLGSSRRGRKVDIKMDLRDGLLGIVSESCSKAGFGVSCAETSGSTALVLVA